MGIKKIAQNPRIPKAINAAWDAYELIVSQYDPKWCPLVPWQRRIIYKFFENPYSCWRLCRDAGKTLLMTHLAVFGKIIDKRVIWISAYWAQLAQAQEYWQSNPFCLPFRTSPNKQKVDLITGQTFLIRGLTEVNVRGPRADWMFYDEVSQMNYEVFTTSQDISNSSQDPHILYASSPVINSLFHKLCKTYPEYHYSYLDCPWINPAKIAQDRLIKPKWKFLQENMAEWTLPQGPAFPNIQEFTGHPPDCEHIRQGVDFGGGKPHTMVRIGEFHGKIYVLQEFAYDPDDPNDDYKLQIEHQYFPCEAETGGSNNAFHHLVPMATKVSFMDIHKYERVDFINRNQVLINPKLTPKTYADITKAVWNEKGKIDTSELDYLAALLHAGKAKAYATLPTHSTGQTYRALPFKRV